MTAFFLLNGQLAAKNAKKRLHLGILWNSAHEDTSTQINAKTRPFWAVLTRIHKNKYLNIHT